MMLASVTTDIWVILLAIGIIATFVSTVALIVGLAPARRSGPAKVASPTTVTALPLRSATSVRDQAAARAKAAAAAASTEKRYTLTDVHIVRPAGQGTPDADGPGHEPVVTGEEADAIVAHFAEHDPMRIAEVITQWIRSDQQHGSDGIR